MRFRTKTVWCALIAVVVLGMIQAARAEEDNDSAPPRAKREGKADAAKDHGNDDQPVELLTIKDISKMRRDKVFNRRHRRESQTARRGLRGHAGDPTQAAPHGL